MCTYRRPFLVWASHARFVRCLAGPGVLACTRTGAHRAPLQGLIDKVDRALTFAIEVEHGLSRADVVNYDEIRSDIVEKLEKLRDAPIRTEEPRVYHLDVAAMCVLVRVGVWVCVWVVCGVCVSWSLGLGISCPVCAGCCPSVCTP
jgi:hypothetical protein